MSDAVNEEQLPQSIYLDFASNAEGNDEKPASSDGIGEVNKSFGKLAPYLLNFALAFIRSLKKMSCRAIYSD